MENTLERINPDEIDIHETAEQNTVRLHLERYHFAGENILPGTIADIACGTGYGSNLLAEKFGNKIAQIFAVDKDKSSIVFAQSRYPNEKITYINSDALDFASPVRLDSIISLETIEHLPEPERFISKMADLLIEKGRFIASVPITPSMDANPFHLHDFNSRSFRNMFGRAGFREINSFIQIQHYNPFRLVFKKNSRMKKVRKNILAFYFKHPSKIFLRIKSLFSDGFSNKYLVVALEKI